MKLYFGEDTFKKQNWFDNFKNKLFSSSKRNPKKERAIEYLSNGIKEGKKFQTLLGVTGSGKTFTMANIIQKVQKPTLVLAHNKTLARTIIFRVQRVFSRKQC